MRSTLFKIFGLPIHSYGLMMVVGFSLGIWRAVRISKKRYGIDPERVYDLALIALFSGVIGARAVYILLNPTTETWCGFFAVWEGGLSFHGGLALAIILCGLYTRRNKLPFWKCADLLAPSIAIGYAFTRIGCFLNGCCYGAPTSLPWGVRFNENGTLTPPSHPTQIYSCLANLVIFFILTRLEKLNRKPGFIFISYIGLYGIYRFIVEIFRCGYSADLWAFGLTQAQAVSVLMTAFSAVLIFTVYREGKVNRK